MYFHVKENLNIMEMAVHRCKATSTDVIHERSAPPTAATLNSTMPWTRSHYEARVYDLQSPFHPICLRIFSCSDSNLHSQLFSNSKFMLITHNDNEEALFNGTKHLQKTNVLIVVGPGSQNYSAVSKWTLSRRRPSV